MPRLALVQMAAAPAKEANLEHAAALIREARAGGADVACLPELFATPFFVVELEMAHFDLAEPIPGPTTERMCELARELGIVIVAPLFEKVGRSVYYNTAAVIDADGTLVGSYRKNHIPMSTLFYEKLYFKPGNTGYPVFDTAAGRLGIYICHDRHYPEGARCLALHGADVLLIPSTTPTSSLSRKVWEKELMAHAVFNEVFVAGLNRVGREGAFEYYGESLVCNPEGDVVAKAGSEEQILLCDLDYAKLDERRRAWQFYRERRPDTYDPIVAAIP